MAPFKNRVSLSRVRTTRLGFSVIEKCLRDELLVYYINLPCKTEANETEVPGAVTFITVPFIYSETATDIRSSSGKMLLQLCESLSTNAVRNVLFLFCSESVLNHH